MEAGVAAGDAEVCVFSFGGFYPGEAEELGGDSLGLETGAEAVTYGVEEGVVADAGSYDVEDYGFAHFLGGVV